MNKNLTFSLPARTQTVSSAGSGYWKCNMPQLLWRAMMFSYNAILHFYYKTIQLLDPNLHQMKNVLA